MPAAAAADEPPAPPPPGPRVTDPDPRTGTVLVDGTNVYASRPDGWWRDRAGAAARLARRLDHWLARTGRTATLVLDPLPRGSRPPPSTPRLAVVVAPRRPRGAADDLIVRLAAESPGGHPVVAYTSDRELRRRLEAVGARTHGAGTLLRAIDRPAPPRPERHPFDPPG